MSSPFNNNDPRCKAPTACKRSSLNSAVCQPCYFDWRRSQAAPLDISGEEEAVWRLGERIGYGRTMQLCEQLWRKSPMSQPGGEHSVGPCVTFLVPCPHPGVEAAYKCEWCCGSGRVTKRVLEAMSKE